MKKISGRHFISLSEKNGVLWKNLFPVNKVSVYSVNCDYTMDNHLMIAQKYSSKLVSAIHNSANSTKLVFFKFLASDTIYNRRERIFADAFSYLDIHFVEHFVITHHKKLLKYTVIDVEENIDKFEKILFCMYNDLNSENFFLVQSIENYEVNFVFLMKIFANSNKCDPAVTDLNAVKAAFIKKLITGKVNGINFFFPFGNRSFGSFETIEIKL